MRSSLFSIFLIFFTLNSIGQVIESNIDSNLLRVHLSYLASDKLHGRMTGSKDEKKAGNYIAKQFKKLGLEPIVSHTYFQPFEFHFGYNYGKCSVKIKGKELEIEKDYDVFPESESTDKLEFKYALDVNFGIQDSSVKHYDFTLSPEIYQQVLLVNLDLPKSDNPHQNYEKYEGYTNRLEKILLYKPSGIILYGGQNNYNREYFRKYNNLTKIPCPVIYIHDKKWIQQFKMYGGVISMHSNVVEAKGRNVVGFLNNHKKYTVVIGAHYDHLGMGEKGNSLYKGPPQIHNGADDNASGTSSLIEMAHWLSTHKNMYDYNFLFCAFSGEELGLLGSNYLTKHLPISKDSISFMFNMDMVGRLNPSTKELAISGTGTSPIWDSIIEQKTLGLKIKTSASGMGPSDHSSFYIQDIPALHFFTGTHPDYHKPSDDIEKINFKGMALVDNYILGLLSQTNPKKPLVFTKTKSDSSQTPIFKVTLGIIPDYFYDKGGLRIDGVSQGKTAEKAGLKAGDIILKLGDFNTTDINDYMKALSQFRKGDEINIKVKRGEKELIIPAKF